MIFAFVDESGKPYPSEADVYPTLTAVCVNSDSIKEITQRLYSAEIKTFGEDPTFSRKLKGNDMINFRAVREHYQNRKIYTDEVVDIMEIYEAAVFSIVMTRPDYNPYYEPELLPNEHRFLLERLQNYGEHCKKDVLVIYDKIHDKDDGRIALGFKRFLFTHGSGRQYNHIVELPLFVASQTHPLIRFPDLAGNIIRKYYGMGFNKNGKIPDGVFEEWLVELFARIAALSMRLPNQRGGYDFGIYEMPIKYLIKKGD
ncbi:MAG: DUF3800 domain-containing protein [Syntrophomonadaceae bacterium]|nr:DUF3800 domain-containing protein [Syntrophomonadaceae bacterium]MDD3888381.1 DUF3800 domain-containing protein [Syntrophomonadaceae bacterium]MDD4549413.1 DUF3800 domain-containing protein [Syntrophomonadaceae bacterium]